MKSLRKCGVLLITMALLASLAACNREPKPGPESSGVTGSSSGATGDTTTATEISSDVSQSDSSGGGDASATGSTKKPGGSKKPDTSTPTKGGGATKRPTTSQATKVFKVEDYGAKGDGKTDDGMAVANAVLAAAKDGSKEKIVQFKAGATYRLASAPASNSFKRVLNVIYADNVKIRGDKTKLLMKAPYRVAYFADSSNIEFSGFIIDYSPKPFSAAKVTAIAADRSYIDFTSDDDLGFTGTVEPPQPYFAFRNRKDERLHYNINKMTKTGDKSYRFYMADSGRVSMASVGESFILPVYGSSHNVGGLFSLSNVNNFETKNVTIYAMPDFGFDVRSNTGTTKFTNVRIEPAPGSKVYLASWRDAFHVKDNLSKLTWDNCYIGPLGDDAFNLSSVICNVDFYNASTKTVSMTPAEGGATREGLKAGDELVAYNMNTGAAIGEAKIAAVLQSSGAMNIRLDRDLPGLGKGCQIALYRFNKNFLVKDSYIEGTVRVRSSGTFQNCKFNVFWVRVENETYVEGPVPKDITFKNCTFTTPYASNPEIFHVGTQVKKDSSARPQYTCKNIVLEGCRFLKGKCQADPGNDIQIR